MQKQMNIAAFSIPCMIILQWKLFYFNDDCMWYGYLNKPALVGIEFSLALYITWTPSTFSTTVMYVTIVTNCGSPLQDYRRFCNIQHS